nr:MAG TPA: Magi 5 toxic peptide family [Bacteriophage sp.]
MSTWRCSSGKLYVFSFSTNFCICFTSLHIYFIHLLY